MIHAYCFLEVLSLDVYLISEEVIFRQPSSNVPTRLVIRKGHATVEVAPPIDNQPASGFSSHW